MSSCVSCTHMEDSKSPTSTDLPFLSLRFFADGSTANPNLSFDSASGVISLHRSKHMNPAIFE